MPKQRGGWKGAKPAPGKRVAAARNAEDDEDSLDEVRRPSLARSLRAPGRLLLAEPPARRPRTAPTLRVLLLPRRLIDFTAAFPVAACRCR